MHYAFCIIPTNSDLYNQHKRKISLQFILQADFIVILNFSKKKYGIPKYAVRLLID